MARDVTLPNDGDRSNYEVKAVAYDKVGHTSQQSQKTGVKLDKQINMTFFFAETGGGTTGDKLGDVVKKQQTFTYDQGGGGGTETTRYFYNKAGMLEYAHLPGGTDDRHYLYDGLGRRILVETGEASVDGQGNLTGFSAADTKKYVYLGGSVIEELDVKSVVKKEYVRGLDMGGGIGSIIYQKKSSDYYYYHYNHKGDVVFLTEADQDLAAYYEYDAWGNTMTEAEVSGVDNPYRYSTKEWDEKSGLYYFGARYYCPEIGRWTQRDPAGIVDGLNMYLYGRDDPASKSDHWGERVSDDVEFVVCTAACALAVEYYYRRTNPEASRLRRTVVSSIICCPFCIDEAYGDSCEETSWEEMKKAIEQRIQELEPKTQRWLPEEVLKQLEWQLLRNKNELLPLTTPECSNPVQNLLEHLGNFITGRDNRFRMR